jgi:hypothetical protein
MVSEALRRWIVPAEWLVRRSFSAGAPGEARPIPLRAWKPLFDGKTLEGWAVTGRNKASWAVEDGAIYCQGKGGGYLRSEDPYADFALAAEFKVDKRTNSGIFVRWSDPRDPVNTGIEVQLLDSAAKARPGKHDSGAIYDLAPPSQNTMRPAGEWNRMVISCQGPYISVRLNGAAVTEINLDRYTQPGRNPDGSRNKFRYALAALPRRGYLGLQDHGGRAWFRSLRLMPL